MCVRCGCVVCAYDQVSVRCMYICVCVCDPQESLRVLHGEHVSVKGKLAAARAEAQHEEDAAAEAAHMEGLQALQALLAEVCVCSHVCVFV